MDDLDEVVSQPGKVVVLRPLTHFLPAELLRAGLRVSRVQVVVDDEANARRGVYFSAEQAAGTRREAYLADDALPQLRRAISRIFREWEAARADHSTREVRFVASGQLRIAARVTGLDCAAEFVVGDDRPDLGRTPLAVSIPSTALAELRRFLADGPTGDIGGEEDD